MQSQMTILTLNNSFNWHHFNSRDSSATSFSVFNASAMICRDVYDSVLPRSNLQGVASCPFFW